MAQAEAALLLFVQLKGGEPLAGVEQDPLGAKRDLRQLLDEAAAGAGAADRPFRRPGDPYLPIPRPGDRAQPTATTSIWPASANGAGRRPSRDRPARPPTPAQRRSADPSRSVWVTANAGTGKTRVLADRVLRLLLEGSDPEGILCITFTKAAAAEMTVRIEERLAAWATAPDDAGAGRGARGADRRAARRRAGRARPAAVRAGARAAARARRS